MSSVDRLERFRVLLGRYLAMDPGRITAEMHLSRDLGLDALDLVLISVRLEEFERVEVPVAAIATAETVADFVNSFHEPAPPKSGVLPKLHAREVDASDSWTTFPAVRPRDPRARSDLRRGRGEKYRQPRSATAALGLVSLSGR